MKFIKITLVIAAITGLAWTLAYAQPPGGPPPGRPGNGRHPNMPPMDRSKMMEMHQEHMLSMAGLTDKEKAAMKRSMKLKTQAHEKLSTALQKLQTVSFKENASNTELSNAVATYKKALAAYRSKIAAEDAALIKKLSPKAQAKSMALGLLDNGFSRFGMMRGGSRGMPGRMPGPPQR